MKKHSLLLITCLFLSLPAWAKKLPEETKVSPNAASTENSVAEGGNPEELDKTFEEVVAEEKQKNKKKAKKNKKEPDPIMVLDSPITPTKKTEKETSLKTKDGEPILRVNIGGRRHGIKKIPMETYLAGVIGNEMNRRWNREALKAQAVAARSYALFQQQWSLKNGRKYDVVTTQADQVFRLKDVKNKDLLNIVAETRGEVLWHEGEVVQAFYSSTCGGKTRAGRMAGLSHKDNFQKVLSDSYCHISPFRRWTYSVTPETLAEKLEQKGGIESRNVKMLKIAKKDVRSGYIQTLYLKDEFGSKEIKSTKVRNVLGYTNIKSHRYTVKMKNGLFVFTGYGFGHGVGLCQYGAKAMADGHKNYKSILNKYYPEIEVRKIYGY